VRTDVEISGVINVLNKKNEKMWNIKAKVLPELTGANGTISKLFRKYLSNIPGRHGIKELQKTAILGTAHLLRCNSTKHSTL